MGGPSQGPSKRVASSSGSSIGSRPSSSSSGSGQASRGWRFGRCCFGRRFGGQSGSSSSGSYSGASSAPQTQRVQQEQRRAEGVRCFQCGQLGHYRSECPQLGRGGFAPSQSRSQTSADTSSDGAGTSLVARGGNQQGRA